MKTKIENTNSVLCEGVYYYLQNNNVKTIAESERILDNAVRGVIDSVSNFGAKVTASNLHNWADAQEKEYKRKQFDVCVFDGVVSQYSLGDESVVPLFHATMNVAEMSGYDADIKSALELIKRSSIMGQAYYNACAWGLKDSLFCFPRKEEVLYQFGRIMAKMISSGISIPEEYKKYIVWRKVKK